MFNGYFITKKFFISHYNMFRCVAMLLWIYWVISVWLIAKNLQSTIKFTSHCLYI